MQKTICSQVSFVVVLESMTLGCIETWVDQIHANAHIIVRKRIKNTCIHTRYT